MLSGKRILVTGLLTKDSIAFSIAQAAQNFGAEVILTSFGRRRRMTERASKALPRTPEILELDVAKPDDFAALRQSLQQRWGGLDGAVHAIAYAPADAMGGNFLHTPPESAELSFRISAYSLSALAEALLPLMENTKPSASLVGLHFDFWTPCPGYDWMGVSKAALVAVNSCLAQRLGEHGVRANLVASGPLQTPAAGALTGSEGVSWWGQHAPLGWDARDATPVSDSVCFLLSDLSRGTTGEVLHVDGGLYTAGVPMAVRE
jgi:enoyl-[acyl-carrier protein] reductase I